MGIQFDVFINFDGNCREAVEFYAKVFKTVVKDLMTYSQTPPDPNYPMNEADRDKVMYAGLQIGNMTAMFMDMPTGEPLTIGNNITPTISVDSKDEVTRLFNELREDGEVFMELSKAFFSELYGMVKDKFGVIWQLLYNSPGA